MRKYFECPRLGVFPRDVMWLVRFAFQACSFNHSDISPSLEPTTCERPGRNYRTRRRLRESFLDLSCAEWFEAWQAQPSAEMCKTSECAGITCGDFVELLVAPD